MRSRRHRGGRTIPIALAAASLHAGRHCTIANICRLPIFIRADPPPPAEAEQQVHNAGNSHLIRAILLSLSLVCFAAAIVAAVLDVTRSIADSGLVATSLASDWNRLSPDSLAGLQGWISENLHPYVWDPLATKLLAAPTWAIFAVLALILAIAARRRRRRFQELFEA
jgi:ABC-type Fe3+ transport system permease subunit